jgi:nucleoside recognition membrane protein YjiH
MSDKIDLTSTNLPVPDSSNENSDSKTLTLSKLIGCSLFGVLFFLMPIYQEGRWTIFMGMISDNVKGFINDDMSLFTLPLFIFSSAISFIYYVLPYRIAKKLPYSSKLIASHWFWVLLSTIGGIASIMLLFNIGPYWVLDKQTGVTAYIDVAGAIFIVIGLGCLFLPFLTDYGLLDFVGTIMRPVYKKLFNLPGRSAVDTLASWIGSSSIAVIMTSKQYERGYYTAKESATIATNFSVVSLPFVLLTSQVAGLSDYFFQLYGSMALICILCAIIVPKLPPLSNVAEQYHARAEKKSSEVAESGYSTFAWACKQSYKTASQSPTPLQSLKNGFGTMCDIFVMMMPAAMTIEFITLALYYHTALFQIISFPLQYLLELLQIPDVDAAAPGVIIGLLDQFVPAIIAGEQSSEITRFILAGLSVTQLIFFAESALLIMRSKIPLTIANLVAIFFIRTAIALPILTLIAHWIF